MKYTIIGYYDDIHPVLLFDTDDKELALKRKQEIISEGLYNIVRIFVNATEELK